MLRQDEDGEWHVDENVPGHQGGRDYEDFCAAANSTNVSPQVVRIVRRWPRTRARPRQRPRCTASSRRTGPSRVRRGNHTTCRGPSAGAQRGLVTINYFDVLAPAEEEPGEGATPPARQGTAASPSLARSPGATAPMNDAPASGGSAALSAEARPFEPEQGVPEEDAAPHPSAPAAERAAEEPGRAATALPSVPSARGSRGQAECALEAFAARAKAERRQLKNRRRNQRRREECRRSASDDARLRKGVHEAFAKQSAEKEAAPLPPSSRSPAAASSRPATG